MIRASEGVCRLGGNPTSPSLPFEQSLLESPQNKYKIKIEIQIQIQKQDFKVLDWNSLPFSLLLFLAQNVFLHTSIPYLTILARLCFDAHVSLGQTYSTYSCASSSWCSPPPPLLFNQEYFDDVWLSSVGGGVFVQPPISWSGSTAAKDWFPFRDILASDGIIRTANMIESYMYVCYKLGSKFQMPCFSD